MTDRTDLEERLWSEPIGGAADDPALDDQLAMHRLLRETVSRRPAPEPSPSFEQALAYRLRRRRARRPLEGRARFWMTLYWLAAALATGIVLGASEVPLPPLTPWSLALWSVLVPASFALPTLARRLRTRPWRLLR